MFEIFISYSTKDRAVAEKICRLLEENNHSCWIAPRNIVPGSHWEASIAQAIENARVFLLLFTPNSNDSEEVAREVSLASYGTIEILPLRLANVKPSHKLAYHLAGKQWAEAYSALPESAAQSLLPTLREKLCHTEAGMPKLPSVFEGEELLDVYDETMNLIAFSTRSLVHAKGLWHKTFHCWFIQQENGKHYVWLQKRSRKKADFPGLYDITAARHLLHGESDRDGIGKIDLELGIKVNFRDTVFLGIRTYAEQQGEFYNREFNSVYLYDVSDDTGENVRINADSGKNTCARSDLEETPKGKIAQICVVPEEAEGLIKIEIPLGLSLFSLESETITASGLFYENGRMIPQDVCLSGADFVPRKDNYYMKLFASAAQFFLGNRYLSI